MIGIGLALSPGNGGLPADPYPIGWETTFSTPGTTNWDPPFTGTVDLYAISGGQAGFDGEILSGGSGGAAGWAAIRTGVSVVKDATEIVSVGAGGGTGTNGEAGGVTYFGVQLLIDGGGGAHGSDNADTIYSGGNPASASNEAGAGGGSSAGFDQNGNDSTGSTGASAPVGGGGGGNGADNDASPAQAGSDPGGGGGGGSVAFPSGGAGGSGSLRIVRTA